MSKSLFGKVDRQFYEYRYTIKFLIMGDSHSQSAIDPRILGNAFNFSTAGENYVQTYYKLQYILKHKIKTIDTVILPVDLHSFSSFRSERIGLNNFYWVKYIDYIELGLYKGNLPYYVLHYFIGRYFSYAGQTNNILRFLCNDMMSHPLSLGFLSDDHNYSKRKRKGTGDAQFAAEHHFKNYKNFDEDLVFYFNKIIELCADYHIKLVLVKYPVTQDYYKQVAMVTSRDALSRKIDAIINKNGTKAVLLDYQQVFFNKDYLFSNPDHLNTKGAKIFSKMVKKALSKAT